MAPVDVSITKSAFISVAPRSIKRCEKFTCMGWVRLPVMDNNDSIILLGIADTDEDVLSDSALRIELVRSGSDFRMRFSNSISRLIRYGTRINLSDEEFHLLTYVCYGNGSMKYYVDGVECASESGTGPEGMSYSTAWSRSPRLGGGPVWVPYLTDQGQSVGLYNWRFAAGLVLHQAWIQELMAKDLLILKPEE